jgi:hypothetical protein
MRQVATHGVDARLKISNLAREFGVLQAQSAYGWGL